MDTNLEDIRHIRSMMERSSKFLSLSGMSGVSAGLIALVGAAITRYYILDRTIDITNNLLYDLIIMAGCILLCALFFGLYFCFKKAKKNGVKLWTGTTLQICKDFGLSMCVGGIFCFILIYQHAIYLTIPSMLIFYGLALIYAGARTYSDIKLLGVCEIILGILSGIFIHADFEYNIVVMHIGLLFWAIGFGVLHIVYGIVMYYKYDLKTDKNG